MKQNNLDLSKFIYCRGCSVKTHHYKDLKYDWGYSCRTCSTWQHQSQLISIQQSHTAKMILDSMAHNEIYYCDASLAEFIEAAQALDMDYDYQQTQDGYDFCAWHVQNQETLAKIKL